MNQSRKLFEAFMRGQGYSQIELEFNEKSCQYVKPSVQTRWRYFLSGWEMAFAMGQQ